MTEQANNQPRDVYGADERSAIISALSRAAKKEDVAFQLNEDEIVKRVNECVEHLLPERPVAGADLESSEGESSSEFEQEFQNFARTAAARRSATHDDLEAFDRFGRLLDKLIQELRKSKHSRALLAAAVRVRASGHSQLRRPGVRERLNAPASFLEEWIRDATLLTQSAVEIIARDRLRRRPGRQRADPNLDIALWSLAELYLDVLGIGGDIRRVPHSSNSHFIQFAVEALNCFMDDPASDHRDKIARRFEGLKQAYGKEPPLR